MTEDEGFKITDRRGRPSEAPNIEPEAAPADAGSHQSAPGSRQAEPGGWPPESPAGPDLQGLFIMFASSALINLGEAPDPATGTRGVDLQQAREAIDMLLLLREKTEGNRTEQETRLLEEIIYDLQMRFVRTAGPGRPT